MSWDPRRKKVGGSDACCSRSGKAELDKRLGNKDRMRWPRVERISRSGSRLGRRGMSRGDSGGEDSGRKCWEDMMPTLNSFSEFGYARISLSTADAWELRERG
ncbi:hypothetical protein F1880_006539 [Penicillium rolfsii]|nr:hypothetical protein F1880_006539 [Penicillium rolfsii]